MLKNLILVILLILLISCNSNKVEFVSIGTGSVTGVYYPAGGAISRMVNNNIQEYNLKVTVESTGGSVYNINAVLNNDIDFGIAQSDRQYQAYFGEKEFRIQTEVSEVVYWSHFPDPYPLQHYYHQMKLYR